MAIICIVLDCKCFSFLKEPHLEYIWKSLDSFPAQFIGRGQINTVYLGALQSIPLSFPRFRLLSRIIKKKNSTSLAMVGKSP